MTFEWLLLIVLRVGLNESMAHREKLFVLTGNSTSFLVTFLFNEFKFGALNLKYLLQRSI